jgi:hypothetical protein
MSEEMTAIDRLMSGSIDMHVHFSTDSLQRRRQSALQLAYTAREMGMRAIVLKSHEYITVPVAILVDELVPDISVFGSITLDNEVGGLNPEGVLTAARMGAKVVWMPTFTAANSRVKAEKLLGLKLSERVQSLFNSAGKLRPEVREILQIVKDYDIVLCSGHLSPREIFALVDEAKSVGCSKIVITHALDKGVVDASLTMNEIRQLAQSGAFIEHSFFSCMPTTFGEDPRQVVEAVKATGAEQCIMTSDFGQIYHPPAPEGMRMFIATMLRKGLEEKEIEVMVKTNPSRLLGIV